MKKVQNWAFFTPKRAKLRSHVAHTNYGRTHAHRTHVLKAFSHAHRTRADVRARVRVRILFRNSQIGYGKYFPLNNLLNNNEVKHKEKLASEFCKRISSDHDGLQLFENKAVYLYRRISRICWQKQNIVMNLGEIPINFEWGYLALKILHDISLHLELLVESS